MKFKFYIILLLSAIMTLSYLIATRLVAPILNTYSGLSYWTLLCFYAISTYFVFERIGYAVTHYVLRKNWVKFPR